MSRELDDVLGPAGAPDTVAVSDVELDDLNREVVRDVTAALMFGERPTPPRHAPERLARAGANLHALCHHLLRGDASKHLARIADSRTDVEGALRFGCLLDLARKPDGALWWWQFSAGAGNATAAYCLYLFHTRRGDMRDANHWWYQHRALGPDDLDLPTSQQQVNTGTLSGALHRAAALLAVDEAAGEFHHPDRSLAEQSKNFVKHG
ncbi:hypothetical protein [Streptomyces chartreusis]